MRDTMTHRGPDGAGLWFGNDRTVGLAHRRLSIIDLSDAASQPMTNHDGSVCLSFNGEIYNHAEIRAELEKTGRFQWKTDHSDTEMILHAYEQWGFDCLEKFRGMFAFAIWDENKRRLWLVRDRIGIKPLYYSIHNGRICFASEIKALLEDPDQKRGINHEALIHYLSFLTTPAPQTLFDGIRKLPGGTWMSVTADGNVTQQRYWDALDHATPMMGMSDDEIAGRVLTELRAAVKLRKVSDVPVGVFLSGGIDSSTNTALFSEGENRPVKSFCIGYEGEYETYKNETHYARQMAEHVGAEYHQRLLTIDDLIDFLPQMVALQDEPIADPVCVPVYYVSKLARDNGVIVCQVGEGADELFWGYESWMRPLKLQRWDNLPVPRFMKRLGVWGLIKAGRDQAAYTEWLRRGAAGQPVFWGGAEAFMQYQKQQLISDSLQREIGDLTSWDALAPIHKRFTENAAAPTTMNWMTYIDLNLRLPELLLMRVDKMSMGVSLETRVPFLDHKLVELAMRIPSEAKTRGGQMKQILKKAVRGLIPDELIDRRKQGFGVPVYEWYSDRLGDHARREIRAFNDSTGLLNPQAVQGIFERNDGWASWFLLNLSLWGKQYLNTH